MLTSNFFFTFFRYFYKKKLSIFKQTLPLCANILEIKLIFKEREGEEGGQMIFQENIYPWNFQKFEINIFWTVYVPVGEMG